MTAVRRLPTADEASPFSKQDLIIATALVLFGVLTRVPYLALVPAFVDEVTQTVFALSIRLGEPLPLVGADPYTGPLFSYILALCLRIFGSTPITPRVVVMVMGALTVGMTYLLARALGLQRPWAMLAGLLMACNPDHILLNSHHAASTVTLPFFSTVFLIALTLAIKHESGPWLAIAGGLLGLAGQANPVVLLMLPGVMIWFLVQSKHVIGLRTRWPYLAVIACLIAYSPLIVYNVQTDLASVAGATQQTYVWRPALSLPAYLQNLERLTLQLCRQVSGVLEGDESLQTLTGWPLLFSAWAIVGLVYAAWRSITLPILAVGSQMLIMPWLSNHYGMTGTTRFTNQLTPLMLVAMSALAEGVWMKLRGLITEVPSPLLTGVMGTALVAISLWPLTSLFRYYDHAVARGETNAPAFAFFDDFMRQWKGDAVLLSDSPIGGKTVEYFLAVNGVPYDLMPLGRIMERLATGQVSGSATLILYDDDLARAGSQAELIAWDVNAHKTGYGVYTISDAKQVRKPSFVFSNATVAPAVRAVQVNLADQLGVLGYEVRPDKPAPGSEFVVNIHWQATAAMPEAYISFLHLIGPNGRLIAQDDHELGRGFYRTIFWQPGEVIREKYTLTLPKDAPVGDYSLRVGVYSFPSLQRLPVRSSNVPTQDSAITLGTLHVGP